MEKQKKQNIEHRLTIEDLRSEKERQAELEGQGTRSSRLCRQLSVNSNQCLVDTACCAVGE